MLKNIQISFVPVIKFKNVTSGVSHSEINSSESCKTTTRWKWQYWKWFPATVLRSYPSTVNILLKDNSDPIEQTYNISRMRDLRQVRQPYYIDPRNAVPFKFPLINTNGRRDGWAAGCMTKGSVQKETGPNCSTFPCIKK